MGILRTWQDLPKATLLKAFEAGNFAGVEEMKRNDRLFERVAPMGVNDIMMAVQYRWAGQGGHGRAGQGLAGASRWYGLWASQGSLCPTCSSPPPCPTCAPPRRHVEREPLNIPIIAFDGRRDATIARGHMRQWRRYTSGRFRNVAIAGDHYFVSKLFREVLPALNCLLCTAKLCTASCAA